MVPYTITHQPSPDDNGYVSAVGAKLTAGQPHCFFSTLKLNVREVPPKKCSKGPFTGWIRKLQRLALVNVILPWNILASKKIVNVLAFVGKFLKTFCKMETCFWQKMGPKKHLIGRHMLSPYTGECTDGIHENIRRGLNTNTPHHICDTGKTEPSYDRPPKTDPTRTNPLKLTY